MAYPVVYLYPTYPQTNHWAKLYAPVPELVTLLLGSEHQLSYLSVPLIIHQLEVCRRHVRVVLLEELQFLKRPMSDQELFEDLIIIVHQPSNFAAECAARRADCRGVLRSKHRMGIKVMNLEPMIPNPSPVWG
jgi:hypothetical protein